jgi:hypothetical protein
MNTMVKILCAATLLAASQSLLAFDQSHATWDMLLKRHVVIEQNGSASRVDYAGFRADQPALHGYLDDLSSVTANEYQAWSREQKLAFLINAYNAFTINLVLTRYPDLKSIKDLGWVLQSPWKKTFFTLLGAPRSLDDVEHGLIRAPGAFDEPRIHFAVNCASIGCPMLRAEAFAATRLDAQLEDGVRRFLGDRSRNRYDVSARELRISRIFDWYKADFESGSRGITSVPAFLAPYADVLADGAEARALLRQSQIPIHYLDYDWSLNDVRH